jgi:hypothetical protein
MTHEHHDREVIVTDSGSGSGMGVILGMIIVLLVILAVWWFALGPGTTRNQGGDINIEVPAPTIEIQPPSS